MYLSELCIKKPIGTYLVMLALLFFGIYGYYLLPVSQLPDISFPTIVVNAALPGASPETMATAVATPLEKRFTTIAGIDNINSKSSLGLAQITLQFSLDKNIDAAALDVQAAIDASLVDLPTNMLYRPSYVKINPAEAPILYLAMYSDSAPLFVVNDYAQRLFGQRLSMINGVAQVAIYGAQKYATRVQLDPNKLSAYKISLLEVKKALQAENLNSSTGSLSSYTQELPIKLNSQLEELTQYQDLIVAFRQGSPIKLRQLGKTIASVENTKLASWFNDKRSIVLAIQRQPGTNTLEIIQKVYKELASLKQQLPKNIDVVTMYDRGPTIKAAVHDVQLTLIISICLVMMVIFLFLRNLKAALIISIVLPLSIIGSFAFMYCLNFSLNIISLLSLTLIVGLIVDDAIVVLENITRNLDQNTTSKAAALRGIGEIGFTVVTITLSLGVVFIPILFAGGIIGRVFYEFAMTSVIAIGISGIISLTLTPMLASKFLKFTDLQDHGKILQSIQTGYQKVFNYYESSLTYSLKQKSKILKLFTVTIIISLILFKFIGKGFIPEQDIGNFICFTQADPDIGFKLMAEKQRQIANVIKQHIDVENVLHNVGAGTLSQTLNEGFIIVKLKPFAIRKFSVKNIIKQLRAQVNQFPGIKVYLQNIQVIPIGGKLGKGDYQYTILDADLAKLQQAVSLLQQHLEKLPQIQDVSNDLTLTTPQVNVRVNRQKAGLLGVNMQDIANTLYNAFGSAQISSTYKTSDSYKVILELHPEYSNPMFLKNLEIKSNNGTLVPLQAIANLQLNTELLTINHKGQVPAATISFNLKPGQSLSKALQAIEQQAKTLNLPDSMLMKFDGTAETFKSSAKKLMILLLIVVVVIYILLGILYESFIHPLTVLSGLPAAFLGALFSLFIFKIDLDLYGFIGLIILMGIVKKNAIMMIDFALEQQRTQNLSAEQAIYNACLVRFRPIMMTTMAALLGNLPIALGIGSVAIETQRSLGVAVVGGLVFSQILTLYITPVLYVYLDKYERKFSQQ